VEEEGAHRRTINGNQEGEVARFLGMMTSSVNRMARLEEMAELDERDK